jgi:archaellum biogenesis ATPase FlaH
MEKLASDFIAEFFKLCFLKREAIEIARKHLKYQYLELPETKKVLKSIISYYDTNEKLPTYGYISQQYSSDVDVQEYLSKIKRTQIPSIETVMNQLEDYIRKVRFELLHQEIQELYNNDKADEAIRLCAEESEKIVRFSLKLDSGKFIRVFKDFEDRLCEKQSKRESGEFDHDKIPTGIRELDEEIHGGIDGGDTVCFLARSGTGKSTLLKWIGTHTCRLGYDVLHIQAEGSSDECFDKYTQVWSAMKYSKIKYGDIAGEELEKFQKVILGMEAKQRDIYIYAFEMFDEGSCSDIRNIILEYEKDRGKLPDILIVDSIDLIHPGDGLKYGISTEAIKMKKENTAKKLKNIATEFKPMRVITADQADNIPVEQWNNPSFVMTRNNVSGAKNLPNSFSYFITVNQTRDEYEKNVIRLHFDKLRNYKPINSTVKIATAYDYGRFYDAKATQLLKQEQDVTVGSIKKTSTKSTGGIKVSSIKERFGKKKEDVDK